MKKINLDKYQELINEKKIEQYWIKVIWFPFNTQFNSVQQLLNVYYIPGADDTDEWNTVPVFS